MKQIVGLDRVRHVVHVRDRVDDAPLLGAYDDLVVVGVDDDGSESLELGHELEEEFLHETVEGASQGGVVEQGGGRT